MIGSSMAREDPGVPSAAHDEMVAGIVAGGRRTPEQAPSPEDFAATRAAERALEPPLPVDVRVEDMEVGGVPCITVGPPEGAKDVTIVYLHGGGYLWLTARTHLAVASALARASGAECVSVDYRRAPEHPYPAAVEDVVAVYRALVGGGTRPDRVAFAGDSAGGGLALAALVALRDEGSPLPAAAVCISPWTDLAVTGASADTADDPVVSGRGLRMMASLYLDGADPTSPTASPLYADLGGLPPLQVQVGTRESLLDDARRVVERAQAAGVHASLVELPGVVHMWVFFGPDLPESRDSFRAAASFILEHTR
jgi:acetyl esterase/lipase